MGIVNKLVPKPSFVTIDTNTGEQISGQIKIKTDMGKFVLSFVQQISVLSDVNINYELMNEFLIIMESDNSLILNKYRKKIISLKLGISIGHIEKCITQILNCGKGVMKRIDTSTYIINPAYWGKGNLKNLSKLSLQYEMIDDYAIVNYQKTYGI